MNVKIGKIIYGGLVLGLLLGAAGAEAVVPCNDTPAYPACSTAATVERWRCWEKSLTSSGSYTNGSRDVKLKVTYELSGHPTATFTSYAFWDGKNGTKDTFRLRTAFSANGRWFWTTTCESGCAAGETLPQTGFVDVITPAAHSLYSNGMLRQTSFNDTSVSPPARTYRPIDHYNGAPFLWQGDSAWAATLRACHQNWKDYVDNRSAKGFTVIHLGLAMDWGGPAVAGGTKNIRNQAPFEQLAGCTVSPSNAKVPNNCSRMNPLFWRELDGMVQYANDKGIVIFITGLIDPVSPWPELAEARIFARNLVSRLAGSFVIYSPAFDNVINTDLLNRIRQVAAEVQSTSRWHLLTNHYSFTVTDTQMGNLHNDTWLAFQMLQSGHNNNDLGLITGRPYDKTRLLRGFTATTPFTSPRKPVVNGEAIYDHNFPSSGTNYFNAYRARQAGWLSWLSGAVGYSYGAAGIWEWMVCAESFAPPWCGGSGVPQPPGGVWPSYQTSMNWDSAVHMQRLAGRLRTVDWWNLNANEPSRVTVQAAQPELRRVTARDPDTLFAYLPHNADITLNLNGANVNVTTARMFDPRSGNDQAVTGTNLGGGVYRFSNPGGLSSTVGSDDWVLVIRQGSSAQMTWAGSSDNRIEVWPQTGNAETGPGIYGQIVPADPEARAREVLLVSDTAAVEVRKPAAARDGAGNFLVVWEQQATLDDLPQIVARRFDSVGNPLAPSFVVAAEPEVAQLRPSVAADSLGRFFIVWQERNGDGRSRVLGQLIAASGLPSGVPFALDSPFFSGDVVSAQGSPRVACAPGGACLAAWELTDADTGERTVRARRYDMTGAPAGLSFQVNAQPRADVWLQRVTMDATGNPDVAWEELDAAGDSLGAWLQAFDSSGAPAGAAQAWSGSDM